MGIHAIHSSSDAAASLTADQTTAQIVRNPVVASPRPSRRAGRKQAALIAAFCTALSVAPALVGVGTANASPLVPCTYGPVETRLEVDCHNNDFTPATVKITAWCSNGAYVGLRQRMAQQSHTHITRDCGPGAHPVVWFVSGESDWEELQDRIDEIERDRTHDHD